MGTRGLFGFYFNGKFYYIYNHFDSYDLERFLREHIFHLLKKFSIEQIRIMFEKLKIVKEDDLLDDETIEKLAMFTEPNCGSGYYQLLRHCQRNYLLVFLSEHLLLYEGSVNEFDYVFTWNLDNNTYTFRDKTIDCIERKDVYVFPKSFPDNYEPPILGKFFFHDSYDSAIESYNIKYKEYREKKEEIKNKIKSLLEFPEKLNQEEITWNKSFAEIELRTLRLDYNY